MKSFVAILLFVGCVSLNFAAPNNFEKETPNNIQLVQSILSKVAEELGKALETNESSKIIPVLEGEIKKLSEALPQLHDKAISQGVTILIKDAQELAQKLTASPNSSMTELESFIGKTLDALLYTSIMQSVFDAPRPDGAEPY